MSYQKISNKIYSNLAVNNNFGSSEKAGRYKSHSSLEKDIFKDIQVKLILKILKNITQQLFLYPCIVD